MHRSPHQGSEQKSSIHIGGIMQRPLIALLALAIALAISPAALADDFNLTFTSTYSSAPGPGVSPNGVSGNGTLSGVEVSPGLYEITGGAIDVGGYDTYASGTLSLIVDSTPGIPAASPSGAFRYDDLLNVANPTQELDSYGLLFGSGGPGGIELVILGNGSTYTIWEFDSSLAQGNLGDVDAYALSFGNFNVTPAPEPQSWLLLGTGLLALMGIAYRRGKSLFAASNLGISFKSPTGFTGPRGR
jgi:hypothetical protein